MRRILLILTTLFLGMAAARAQDSTYVVAPMDSTLLGRDILSVMGSGVQVSQSQAVRQALQSHIRNNAAKTLTGYRIRVFYDSAPTARQRSEAIAAACRGQFPDTGVYRTFESPNYKVTVGDFRTKDEALRIFNALKRSYPTAFIIKETINYPR
jgi:hypothetical protein